MAWSAAETFVWGGGLAPDQSGGKGGSEVVQPVSQTSAPKKTTTTTLDTRQLCKMELRTQAISGWGEPGDFAIRLRLMIFKGHTDSH
jgi:hypothetical protein